MLLHSRGVGPLHDVDVSYPCAVTGDGSPVGSPEQEGRWVPSFGVPKGFRSPLSDDFSC